MIVASPATNRGSQLVEAGHATNMNIVNSVNNMTKHSKMIKCYSYKKTEHLKDENIESLLQSKVQQKETNFGTKAEEKAEEKTQLLVTADELDQNNMDMISKALTEHFLFVDLAKETV